MATSEFNTVLFKVLFYAYECLKAGVEPDIAKARELADVNERYFTTVIKEAVNEGYLSGIEFRSFLDCPEPAMIAINWSITHKGAEHIDTNDQMKSVSSLMSTAFGAAVSTAINLAATKLLGF